MGYFSEMDIERQNKEISEERRLKFLAELEANDDRINAEETKKAEIRRKIADKEMIKRTLLRVRMAKRLSKNKQFLAQKFICRKEAVTLKKAGVWKYPPLNGEDIRKITLLAMNFVEDPDGAPNFKSHHKATK